LATKKLHPLNRRAVILHIYSAGFLAFGTLLFAFPANTCQWLNKKSTTPDYSGGTVPDFDWIPFTDIRLFTFQKNFLRI